MPCIISQNLVKLFATCFRNEKSIINKPSRLLIVYQRYGKMGGKVLNVKCGPTEKKSNQFLLILFLPLSSGDSENGDA